MCILSQRSMVHLSGFKKMITVRSKVKFKHNNRDKAEYIVRELRMGNKVLIQSIYGDDYYIVPVDDLILVV